MRERTPLLRHLLGVEAGWERVLVFVASKRSAEHVAAKLRKGGYSAETGGKLANLRRLTNAQVRRYHAENYRPDNTAFIVSGMVSEAAFLAALSQVDAALGSG